MEKKDFYFNVEYRSNVWVHVSAINQQQLNSSSIATSIMSRVRTVTTTEWMTGLVYNSNQYCL